MSKTIFATDHVYHIYNRGIEKRDVFLNNKDYYRFIHDLYEFNDKKPVINTNFYFNQNLNYRGPTPIVRKRDLLVDILCFCLMPNHFHLLLRQRIEGGISLFMQKLGGGYTTYFNKKYDRSGVLFQGRHKAVYVDNESYFTHLSRYIHLNPVDLIEPGWKEKGIQNWEKVNQFLESYKWSSYQDYIGKKNVPSLLDKNDIIQTFNNHADDYKKFVNGWLAQDFDQVDNLVLEK